jgi:hypothetical protein
MSSMPSPKLKLGLPPFLSLSDSGELTDSAAGSEARLGDTGRESSGRKLERLSSRARRFSAPILYYSVIIVTIPTASYA